MKIENIANLSKLQKSQGNNVGYTSGVFDLFHRGHIAYLSKCRSLCDYLIVGVDCDDLVRRNKGENRPFDPEEQRIRSVLGSSSASIAFIKQGSSDSILPIILPSIYFIPDNKKISDERSSIISRINARICIVPYTAGVSTTLLSKK